MKTSLDINDALMAARQQISLTRLIEEGLQLRLRLPRSTRNQDKVTIPVF